MNEITITTNKIGQPLGTSIEIWNWEVPVYLFLGGITAGILVVAALMIIKNREKEFPVATNKIILAAPVLISLGMLALFLDLSHKLYVWRFYTSFSITSPMSWGAWILVFVYPFSILLILGTFRQGFPVLYNKIEAYIKNSPLASFIDQFYTVFDFAEKYKTKIAYATLPVGVLLGIYTGILLSSFGARPFWNSALMGPLFLVSGVSTGVALIVILAKDKIEREYFTKIDIGLITVELIILVLFIIGMATSTAQHINAIDLILGGELTPVFWIFIVGIGLSLPAFLEWLELRGGEIPATLPAALVLTGGLFLRFIFVEAGQISSWLGY